ncbi:cyclin-domain-containing protein [Gaertneriomyces semiglobifer]|nr:cyclin-domain-containing protein [Gaertneriomyces semiglobifer]
MSVALPEYFHHVDIADLTVLIADMLNRLITHNDRLPALLAPNHLTRFHSRAPPGISILDYMKRIVRYANIERVVLLILLIYVDRICERERGFVVCSLTVHRVAIAGVCVGCKALCDTYLTNTMYAKVGGITTKELNLLEVEFLRLIDWKLVADVEIMQGYYVNLVKQHPNYTLRSSIPSIPHNNTPTSLQPYFPPSNSDTYQTPLHLPSNHNTSQQIHSPAPPPRRSPQTHHPPFENTREGGIAFLKDAERRRAYREGVAKRAREEEGGE